MNSMNDKQVRFVPALKRIVRPAAVLTLALACLAGVGGLRNREDRLTAWR